VEVVGILVMLELGEGIKDISGLIEVVGANTILIDSDIETELVDCRTVEVVIDVVEGGTVVGKIVVNAIIVGSEIEVVEGSGISHNWYS